MVPFPEPEKPESTIKIPLLFCIIVTLRCIAIKPAGKCLRLQCRQYYFIIFSKNHALGSSSLRRVDQNLLLFSPGDHTLCRCRMLTILSVLTILPNPIFINFAIKSFLFDILDLFPDFFDIRFQVDPGIRDFQIICLGKNRIRFAVHLLRNEI